MRETEERRRLRRGRRLEYFTIGYNLLEALASLAAGVLAGSTALVGFGADSLIECASGAVLIWRLSPEEGHAAREERALRLVGVSFLLLAAYVAWDAGSSLLRHRPPEESWLGIGIAVLSLLVMPWLARRKRAVAREIGSGALEADSRQTSICAYLSAILLGGLALNALLGWWWADSAAALLMVPILVHEGLEGLRGERCDDCRPA
jgi:divalent metal cation (Fe/Co/Zn/Cd) transporter